MPLHLTVTSDPFVIRSSPPLGLDQITNDRGSPCALSRQRKAASKATEQQRSMLKDGDEDYNPKGTPGCHSNPKA